MGVRRLLMTAVTGALVLGVLSAQPSTAAPGDPGAISSSGPLSSITISPDLNCDVRHTEDTDPEFYGATACGTFVAFGGTLYGPASVPAGGSLGAHTGYTPVSQTAATGAGTTADPYRVVTKVDLGDTGVQLTQTDTYVAGEQSYATSVSLANGSGSDVDAAVYRAGDCYAANSDSGLGRVTESAVACVSASSDRVEQWVPITPGSHYYEAGYSQVWAAIATQQQFPDTCRCEEDIDNGSGLSWTVRVPSSGVRVVRSLTAFSPVQQLVDADGDGLLDDWETNGLDADGDGVVDVDLPAMGATADHKDLFVEADWMAPRQSCFLFWCWDRRDFAPDQAALTDVRAAFAAAPVGNPDGHTGVRLHIDSGRDAVMNPTTGATWGNRSRANEVPHTGSLGAFSGSDYDWTAYNHVKDGNFAQARADVFHYALFADTYAGSGSSGIAQVGSGDGFKGDSFLVTDGGPGWGSGFSRRQESGTFMHEFGHTLSLHHGGGDDGNHKPNYQSIMNYSWQLGGRDLDYSGNRLPTLDEGSLDEADGIPGAVGPFEWFCGTTSRRHSGAGAVDWNCNGSSDQTGVSADLNAEGGITTLAGWDDWAHLVYDGGAVGAFGIGDLGDQSPPPATTLDDEPTAAEFKEADDFAADGDGTVAIVGPNVLFSDRGAQVVQATVTNPGSVPADYTLALTGLPGAPASVPVTAVAAGATRTLDLAVDSTGLTVGSYTLEATLRGATDLDQASLPITVPDLSDPATRADVEQIRDFLGTPHEGIPESLREQFLDDSGRALAPVNSAAPTFGAARVGTVATASPGRWDPAEATFTYQWLRDGHPIARQTRSTYTPTAAMRGHLLSVAVTATGTGGSTTMSAAAKKVQPGIQSVPRPTITGSATVGSRLTARLGATPASDVVVTYRWLRDGKAIRGATRRTHLVVAKDRGHHLAVKVVYKRSGYLAVAKTSRATRRVVSAN